MPDREEIISRAKGLVRSSFEPHLNDDQVWSGRQYGANFELTRGVVGDNVDLFSLIVTGRSAGKPRVVQDFIDALGEPQRHLIIEGMHQAPYLDWDAGTVLEKSS